LVSPHSHLAPGADNPPGTNLVLCAEEALSIAEDLEHKRPKKRKAEKTRNRESRLVTAMNDSSIEVDETEEQNLLICDIADQLLEAAATTKTETRGNITWYYCPTGLTICRL